MKLAIYFAIINIWLFAHLYYDTYIPFEILRKGEKIFWITLDWIALFVYADIQIKIILEVVYPRFHMYPSKETSLDYLFGIMTGLIIFQHIVSHYFKTKDSAKNTIGH